MDCRQVRGYRRPRWRAILWEEVSGCVASFGFATLTSPAPEREAGRASQARADARRRQLQWLGWSHFRMRMSRISLDATGVRRTSAWINPSRVPSAAYTREVAPSAIGLRVSSGGAELATETM
jgi:hypothetical protein